MGNQIRCKECNKLFIPTAEFKKYCGESCAHLGIQKTRKRYFQSSKGMATLDRWNTKRKTKRTLKK